MKRLLFILILVIITLVACSENNKEEKQVERVTPVETGEVTKGDLVMERNFYGRTMPNQTIPIIPTVAGEIDELNVENGDKVEEDDEIATISSPPQGNIKVEATSTGTITQLQAQEGSLVSNQDPLAVVIDLEQLTVQLQVPDVQLELFEKGKKVTLILESAEEETLEAEIEYVASAANEAGLFPIDLSFDNETTHHKAGVIATVVLEDTVIDDSLLIPTAALVEDNDGTYVFTTDGKTATKVEVTVQATQSQSTAVQAELKEGDQLITSGQLTLEDGAKIKVIEED
ncbi:cobalt/zinc/cadmium efflux RND transporter [Gracilibacillus boraciitolerans JCM 21714]|uniref:Cobalt/zinc/cadmium efflux RND transporter n=1 Tax=Gracilibacillus boraciitolerans JCM 21714 TaxID=1298598 RepID=W4VGZ6_9BACI|nr:efflux RND transporter periplasmic adaptor subunit [Gracilibacillus boraciitolerans]GAE92472.1 cobalt/zinc/cadmium efflux RND transporter [Gracilibacillus boraciitolerans JCM 21714]